MRPSRSGRGTDYWKVQAIATRWSAPKTSRRRWPRCWPARRRRRRSRDGTPYPEGPAASPGFLLWHLTLAWQRAVTAALEPLDLTHVQFVLLACAWWLGRQGQVPNQLQLARQAGTDVKMTSQVVRKLEAKGLLERQIDPGDTRARRLRLTAEGNRLARRAISASRRPTPSSSGRRPLPPPRCCSACSATGYHATAPPRRLAVAASSQRSH
jgi:DNA-binding MarR family transcriptional regulator